MLHLTCGLLIVNETFITLLLLGNQHMFECQSAYSLAYLNKLHVKTHQIFHPGGSVPASVASHDNAIVRPIHLGFCGRCDVCTL